KHVSDKLKELQDGVGSIFRRCICWVLHAGPIPSHIALIMDGNRRYAKKQNLEEGSGHKAGYVALMNMLRYCYELEVKYVTIYAFSIDNFKRRPEEVQSTMELIQEKIEELIREESIVNHHGVRVYFVGDLELLSEPVRLAAQRAMKATAGNSKAVLSICLAYTSTDEIVHAVQEACEEKMLDISNVYGCEKKFIELVDIEKHMYMALAPDPDIIIRTSGETRLSNFLLWQSGSSLLYSPNALWPEIGFRHLVQVIIEFQKKYAYLEKKMKQ
ncbi:hypothetical protein M569_02778, partial [Genlisea aurea]